MAVITAFAGSGLCRIGDYASIIGGRCYSGYHDLPTATTEPLRLPHTRARAATSSIVLIPPLSVDTVRGPHSCRTDPFIAVRRMPCQTVPFITHCRTFRPSDVKTVLQAGGLPRFPSATLAVCVGPGCPSLVGQRRLASQPGLPATVSCGVVG